MQDLTQITHALLLAAKKSGAEAADALVVTGTSLSIDIRKSQLEQAERSESTDIGLRVLIGGRQACVSASDTSQTTLEQLAERAVAMAREAPNDPYAGLAAPDQLARDWDVEALELCDPAPEPSAAALEQTARVIEAAALESAGITQVDASASYGAQRMHLAASNGFSGGYARSGHSQSAVAFTGSGTGMERDYAAEGRIFAADMPESAAIGHLAAERARERLGAVKPKTGTFAVLFDERVSSSLIGHLLSAVNGASIARGASWLRSALGTQVLPKGTALLEDPHRPRISGSRPFDGEGLPTARRLIIDDGILLGWTLDLATARQLEMTPTGSAARGTATPPSPASGNVDLTPGTLSRDDLIAQMGTGLLVTSMIGATINSSTGDYSRGAAGFWVENGQISHAVNECTIAGNLRDMLVRIIAANDARAHLSVRVPSLLIDGMTLAGA